MNTLANSDVFTALNPLLLLAVGIAAIAIVSAIFARRMTDARRTRGLWQVAIITMFALAALELSGGAPRLVSALLPQLPADDEVASKTREESSPIESSKRDDDRSDETAEPIEQSNTERVDHLPTNTRHEGETKETDVRTNSRLNRIRRSSPSIEIEPTPAVRWPSDAVDLNSRELSTDSEENRTESEPPVPEVADSAVSSHPQIETEEQPESTPELTAGPPTLPTLPTIGKSSNTSAALLIGGILLASTCITVVLLLRIAIGRLRLFWFRRRLPRVSNADLLECVRRLRKRFKLRRSIELRESDAVTAPIAFGILRPTIVLPLEFAQQTTRQQQEVVLAHEVTHLSGGDSAWQLAADLVAAVLWWHPGVWFARKRLHAACEWVADESSNVVPHGPDILAECLVAIGKSMRPSRQLAWLSAQGSECQSALARRVERLLNMSTRRRKAMRRGSTSGKFLLALVLTISVVFCTAWARPGLVTKEGAENMSSAPSSWKHCVAAAVVAVFGTSDVNTADASDALDETELVYLLDDEDGDRDRPRREGDRDRRDGDREHGDRDRPRREGDREHGDRDREHREGDRDRPRREGERDRPDAERVMRELHGRMEALKREAHQIRARLEKTENRESEEARHLVRKLHEIEKAMHATRAHAEATERMLHQKAVSRRIEELKRQHARLKEAGRHEEAERVANQAREIMRVVERERDRERPRREESDRDHRRDRDRDGHHEEAHHRLEHLHRAIENLHEAGLEEQARRLEEQAERIERELGGRRDRDRDHEHDEEDHDDHEHAEHLEREVHELREEMQDLRNELREMRRAFREVIEELEDLHEDEDDDEDEDDEDELDEDEEEDEDEDEEDDDE